MDELRRCPWANTDSVMQRYHDIEWGVPECDSRRLWEALVLESFQAGLSWEIILRKREAFREAFAGFDPKVVAAFGPGDIERLVTNPGIVRARAKIVSTIRAAQIFNDMMARGEDFAKYCWSFTGGQPTHGAKCAAESASANRISEDLKRRGFKFVGPTIVYAWMQAVGIVNDHVPSCFRYREIGG